MRNFSANAIKRRYEVGHLFTPATPIPERDLFAGRSKQIEKIISTISQRGQHAIIFGERGVGKTSLATVLAGFFQGVRSKIVVPRITCHTVDTFPTLWARILRELPAAHEGQAMGLKGGPDENAPTLFDVFPNPTPDSVREALDSIADEYLLVLIVDEFDRMAGQPLETQLFADTIKTLSDHATQATLVLVGVADSVDELIAGHESIQRNLVQIPMPRMSSTELQQIVTDRLSKVGMTIEEDALAKICSMSRGLPHYTHLVGQHAAWAAIDADQPVVTAFHVGCAMNTAIADTQQTVQSMYHKATMSPRKDNLFGEVLLACALAPADDFGYFAAADVRPPLSEIMGEVFDIPRFAKHLKAFSEGVRGDVLQEIGGKHQKRFRFKNPLMQPYVIIRGIQSGTITLDQLSAFPEAGNISH